MVSAAHARFAGWVKDSGLSHRAMAERLATSATFVSELCLGKKWPGRAIANAIERESADWGFGAIKSEEWDAAEIASKASKATEAA
jgi:hypothetical protein